MSTQVSRRAFLVASAAAPLVAPRLALGQAVKESKTMVVTVPEQKVPVLAECDVLVCGGGVSGITAAVSAARHGASVVLLERWPMLGGMATAALVTGWHRSDREKMVIYGLVEETAQRAEKHGWIWKDPQYPRAHETHWFEPEGMKIVYHDMLDEAKVRTFCYTVAGEPILEGGRIRGVLADTKRGRRAVLAKIVVDATGDGDVAAKAGVPFEFGRASDGRVQGMTMMYRVCNIDEAKVKSFPPDKARAVMEAMRAAIKAGELPPFNHAFSLGHARNRFIPNMCPVSGNPLDEEELTRLTIKSRRQVHAYWDWLRTRVPGLEKVQVEQTGVSLGIRESRRIKGLKTLDAEMILGAAKQRDAIGHGIWMIDIHDPLGTGYTTWNDRGAKNMLPAGKSYHIPLGMCLNPAVPNLAVAGRCASSTHEGHSSVRVQTHCMVMGQGVGTAAAMALDAGCDLAQVDIPRLQAALKKDGVYLEDIPAEGT
ncbi:MAG TPA: FAD-dependent oxidoreductase [Planctomycetota bacterium]|nr:FAD-dependent oxidoreductase [Planctomycetota bacterium]HRR80272.1 FAD-dependent oxidoreductase [Planctomycetota bacterium]HRT93380.1 FAD-dependent oxidoreductase [Planctomycetota bacterium]